MTPLLCAGETKRPARASGFYRLYDPFLTVLSMKSWQHEFDLDFHRRYSGLSDHFLGCSNIVMSTNVPMR